MVWYREIFGFLMRVRQADARTNLATGPLKNLIEVLNRDHYSPEDVRRNIQTLAATSDATYLTLANKFRQALWYLQETYPIKTDKWVSVVPNESLSSAAYYEKTNMPANFNTYQIPPQTLTEQEEIEATKQKIIRQASGIDRTLTIEDTDHLMTKNCWLGKTIEEHIITSDYKPGVILIHLGDYRNGMETMIDGYPVVEHIKSVLRVAQKEDGDLCNLHMTQDKNICNELRNDVAAFAANRIVDISEPERHMGGRHQAFRDFVKNHNYVIVMGFDADICVRANLFGAPEHYGNKHTTVPPILSMANVVTSRAVLVSKGQIGGGKEYKEYGVLLGK